MAALEKPKTKEHCEMHFVPKTVKPFFCTDFEAKIAPHNPRLNRRFGNDKKIRYRGPNFGKKSQIYKKK